MSRLVVAAVALLAFASAPAAGQPRGEAPLDLSEPARWPLDEIVLHNGRRLAGVITEEADGKLRLLYVRRSPGVPAVVFPRTLRQSEIASLKRLEPSQRDQVRKKVQALQQRDALEAQQMDSLALVRGPQGTWRWEGTWFTLISSLDEEITRRAIVRLQQVFEAYRRLLPPREASDRPLQIVLLGSREEYGVFLRRVGLRIENPAYFSAEDNQVVAACELAALAEQLAAIQRQHQRYRDQIRDLQQRMDDEVRRQAKRLSAQGFPGSEISRVVNQVRGRFSAEITRRRRQLDIYERRNQALFDQATDQTFRMLYHEAFHAYLENYVYSHRQYDVPRWLNEGLAQVFQSGLLESGQLRIDAPDGDMLRRLQADLRQEPLPLAEVLADDYRNFLVLNGADAGTSARHYLYAWGLAWWLAFDRQVLGTEALDRYMTPRGGDEPADPVRRFEELVGMPLSEAEIKWRCYLLELR